MVLCILLGVFAYNFQKMLYFSEDRDFGKANSADLDEMLHYPAFRLGLHC